MSSASIDRSSYLVHASVAVLDVQGRLLLVQEDKAVHHGRWNLPGGHVDHGESLTPAAERELLEETCLRLPMRGLLGVYPFARSVRFVFTADGQDAVPQPGDEILAVRWMALNDLLSMDDAALVSANNLKTIARDLQRGVEYPLALLHPVSP